MTSAVSMAQTCPSGYDPERLIPGEGILRCTASGGVTTWTIKRPEVRRRITEYPEIRFKTSNKVRVTGEGCVDTGGKGATWKRYVDPQGIDTDRLYHGLIWIPGARVVNGADRLNVPVGTSLVRLSSITPARDGSTPLQELEVGEIPGVKRYLRLGYEDDNYEDNGYPALGEHGERDGNPTYSSLFGHARNDCKTYKGHPVPDATVTIGISRGDDPATAALGSLDPVSTVYDSNGFQLSPAWFGTYPKPEKPNILRQCDNFRYVNPLFVHEGVWSPCSRQASFVFLGP